MTPSEEKKLQKKAQSDFEEYWMSLISKPLLTALDIRRTHFEAWASGYETRDIEIKENENT